MPRYLGLFSFALGDRLNIAGKFETRNKLLHDTALSHWTRGARNFLSAQVAPGPHGNEKIILEIGEAGIRARRSTALTSLINLRFSFLISFFLFLLLLAPFARMILASSRINIYDT